MENEMKSNLIKRLQTGAKNVPSMKHLAAILFFNVVYLFKFKTTSNPLFSTLVRKLLMINYHTLSHMLFL